jgi:hypothetical protein
VKATALVFGLVEPDTGAVLAREGVTGIVFEVYLSLQRSSADAGTVQDGIPLGNSALKAFERAETEARARKYTYLGIEHLLLGILGEEAGEAADLFGSVHINRGQLAQAVREEIR